MVQSFNHNLVFEGLGTYTFIVPNSDVYVIDGKITLPTIQNGGGESELLVTLNKNGSPVYVGPLAAHGFQITVNCAAGDTMALVFSSSDAVDQAPNVIKSMIAISQGPP